MKRIDVLTVNDDSTILTIIIIIIQDFKTYGYRNIWLTVVWRNSVKKKQIQRR